MRYVQNLHCTTRRQAQNRELLRKLGYLGMVIPEAYGGVGAPVIQATILLEALARVCCNTATVAQLATTFFHIPGC